MLVINVLIIASILIAGLTAFYLPGRTGPQPYLTAPLLVSEIEEGGWELVFRATAGNGEDVFNAWTKGTVVSTQKPLDMGRSASSHFRDPRVIHWENLQVQYVKLALYKQSQEVAYVVFDGLNTNVTSWFNGSRVEASSWSDLTRQHGFNYFAIQGHIDGTLERTFFINSHYGGCDQDLGHLVVVEHNGGCAWDDQPIYPAILYSDMNGADYWNRRQFGRADYLAIFISTEQAASIIDDPPPYKDGVRINSPHYLCKLVENKKNATYTLVSQYEKNNTIHYTLRVYATCEFSLSRIVDPYKKQYEKRISKSCTFVLVVKRPLEKCKFYITIDRSVERCNCWRMWYISGDIQNNPIYQVKIDNSKTDNYLLVELFGPKRGYTVLQLDKISGGVYNISPSTFRPGEEGPFFLDINSNVPFIVQQIR